MFFIADMNVTEFRSMTPSAIVSELQRAPFHILDAGKKIAYVTAPATEAAPAPVTNTTLYKNPDMQFKAYVNSHPSLNKLDQPTGIWLGNWSGNIYDHVKNVMNRAGDQTPVFVAYNIPGRDNGNYSAGGAGSRDEYFAWIGGLGAAIGDKKAIVVLEPDALGLSREINEDQKRARYEMVSVAIDILKKQPNVKVYVDASMWVPPAEMAEIMRRANIGRADGFSINVSGFEWQDQTEKYGQELSSILGKPFVIDTSRNGNGPMNNDDPQKWCNPGDRRLGHAPQMNPKPNIDAYLWIKAPGESDGYYNAATRQYNAPSAGQFYLEKALELVR